MSLETVRQSLADGNATAAFGAFVALLRQNRERAGELAVECGRVLVDEYSLFSVQSVSQFARMAKETMPPQAAEIVLEPLRPVVERTQHWVKELDGVTRERLAREARAAVTLDDAREAARLCVALVARARTDRERSGLQRYVVEALGGLLRDRERSERILRALFEKGHLGPVDFDWREVFQQALARRSGAGFEESDRAWVQVLGGATTALLEFVPGKREPGEPTPEQIERFVVEMGAVLRAGMSGGDEDMLDALLLLREFCPTDPSFLPSLAGAEPRMFLELGGRAKLVAVRGIAAFGEIDALRARVLQLAASAGGQAHAAALADAMGGLRHADFQPWLERSLSAAKTARQQEPFVEAMSRIAAPGAVEMIASELGRCMRKATDANEAKRARMLLGALGRVARGRALDGPARNALVRRVVGLVGDADTELSAFCAREMFAGRTSDLDRDLREWAAEHLVDAIFRTDRGADLRATDSPLGHRGPLVATLQRLGKDLLPAILKRAEPHAGRYSGALPAFAEALQKIGDERAVPILERMIETVFLKADEPSSTLLKEKVRDAASGEMRELDRGEVLHALLYALEEIGGERGQASLLEFADRVQAGQLQALGDGASKILFEAKRRAGSIGKIATAAADPGADVPESDVAAATKTARGGFFVKPAQQIAAIATLGRAVRPESLPTILGCMTAKDPMVRAAAESALRAFATPLPDPVRFDRILEYLLLDEGALAGHALDVVLDLARKSFPKRPPYDGVFERRAREMNDGALAHRLRVAMKPAEAPSTTLESLEKTPERAGAGAGGGGGGSRGGEELAIPEKPRAGLSPTGLPLTPLDLKMKYMQERQKWIAGGKKGPPPEPPA